MTGDVGSLKSAKEDGNLSAPVVVGFDAGEEDAPRGIAEEDDELEDEPTDGGGGKQDGLDVEGGRKGEGGRRGAGLKAGVIGGE